MANVHVTNIGTVSAMVIVSGLQYNANEYDNIRFRFSCHGRVAVDYSHTFSSESTTIYFDFTSDYLGYSWFTPNTDYRLVVICTYNGVDYILNAVDFTTDNISAPSGSITPSLFTKIKEQTYETCVPMCLSTAMDRFRASKVGTDYENFSVSYIFGNGGYSWGMNFEEAIENCERDGSPRWDLVSTSFIADEKSITNARITFNNADNYVKSNAAHQKFSGHINIDPYDVDAVKSAVQNYGCFMLNIRTPQNLYNIGSNGIIPQPNTYVGANHSLLVIGLTTKNGKPHWVVQNSWGVDWGDNGYGYFPYDWGIGANPPSRSDLSTPSSWTLDSYAVYNNSASGYVPPTPTNATTVKNGNLSALVSWNPVLSGALYTIFASRKDHDEWYIKGRTTANSMTISFDNYAEYKIRVVTVSSNYYSEYSSLVYVALASIVPWEWYTPKNELDMFNPVTVQEWLDFCSKINEVRTSKGLAPYSFTTDPSYISGGKGLYAFIFLQAANAINAMGGIAPQLLTIKSMSASPYGDDSVIYPWYWTNLKTALNNAISS